MTKRTPPNLDGQGVPAPRREILTQPIPSAQNDLCNAVRAAYHASRGYRRNNPPAPPSADPTPEREPGSDDSVPF